MAEKKKTCGCGCGLKQDNAKPATDQKQAEKAKESK